jgi:hypothetical protein
MAPMTPCLYDECPAKAEVDDLKGWQSRQNGSLQRIEEKVDKLQNSILGATFTILVALFGYIVVHLLTGG